MSSASARETAARVALGAIARQLIEAFGVEVFAHVVDAGYLKHGELVVSLCRHEILLIESRRRVDGWT